MLWYQLRPCSSTGWASLYTSNRFGPRPEEQSRERGNRDYAESRSTPDDTYATPEPSYKEEFDELVRRIFPSSSPRSTDRYAAPESANIEPPAVPCTAVRCGTGYASDGTSPHFSTQDSSATPDFKEIEEEGKRAGEITKAKKEAIQSQAAPPRVQEASPKAISPTDADLTGADSSDVEPSVPALLAPAVRAPAVQAPAVNIPAFQGPAFRVPAFQGPAYHVPTFQTPAVPTCCVAH